MSTIYGPEPQWRVEDIQTDERTGACTMEMVKPWSPLTPASTNNRSGPTLASVVTNTSQLALPPMPAPPSLEGWVAVRGKWRLLQEGGYGFAYSYEGYKPPTAPAPSGTGPNGVVWTVRGSFRQRPIQTHPNFSKLATTYQWDQGTQSFPAQVTAWAGSTPRGLTVDSSGNVYSQFYGVTSYDDLSAVLTKTVIWPVVDTSLFAAINTIVDTPWDGLGQMPDGRNWKVMPPSLAQHADQWRYEQSYMLSGPGGWNTDVYGQQALSSQTDSGGMV